MSPAPSLEELIKTIKVDASTGEPLGQLSTASITIAEIDDTTDSVLSYFVDQCRRAGHSWNEISEALGVTRQAAHKRFAISPGTDRFTPRARTITPAAQLVAQELGHTFVGTEHLLLALFEAEGLAAKVLYSFGVKRRALLSAILKLSPRGETPVKADPVFTVRAAEVMSGATSEAMQLGHNYVGTEHLLLALFRDEQSVAFLVLTKLGLSHASVVAEVTKTLGRPTPSQG